MQKKTAAGRKRVKFALDTDPGQKVYVAGSFNDWNPEQKPMKDKSGTGHYEVTLLLEPGIYEYKFRVSDAWCTDPTATDWIANNLGSLNSVVRVG